ncbi:hypothetical protein QOZ80_5AG0363350 [Eleusine coracana subsp. coracana]|nr:hypothetical protein QOZ80_5AG0363350 [Eleusine coracana subsp. coracana]
MAKVAAALLCVLLVLSSSAVTTTEAGRHWGRRDDATAAAMATATVRGHFTKVMREEMEMDDGVGLGESKRRSPGGPDPQHH